MLRYLFTFATTLGLVIPLSAQEPAKPKGRKVAFLVGVNNYLGSGFNCLSNSETDLLILSGVLKRGGYDEVITMFNGEVLNKEQFRFRPRAQNLAAELEEYCKTLTEEDTLLFAYSGHSGVVKKDQALGLQLFPLEVRVTRPETMLPLKDIYTLFEKKCKAKHKIILLAPSRDHSTDDDLLLLRLSQEECPEIPQPPKSIYVVSACKTGGQSASSTTFFLKVADFMSGNTTSGKTSVMGADLFNDPKLVTTPRESADYVKGDLKAFEKIELASRSSKVNWSWAEYTNQNRLVSFEKNTPKQVLVPFSPESGPDNYEVLNPMTGDRILGNLAQGWYSQGGSFSHDGKHILLQMSDPPSVKVLDAKTGKLIDEVRHTAGKVKGKPNEITTACFSPDGKLVLSCDKLGHAIITSIVTKKEVCRVKHSASILAACFLHDDAVVTLDADDKFCAWVPATGRKLWHTDSIHKFTTIAVSPTKNEIALANEKGKLAIHSSLTGERIDITNTNVGVIRKLMYSPDGKNLLLQAAYNTTVYDIENGRTRHEFEHESSFSFCTFSPDGTLIATCDRGGTIKIWDMETGRCKRTLKDAAYVVHVAFSPDGKILVSLSNWGYSVFDMETGKRISGSPQE